jgi:hypothetical protein
LRGGHIQFLSNNLFSFEFESKDKESITQIIDINTDKIILTRKNSTRFIFNNELNHLYYFDVTNKKILCLNISNLITGVSPTPINTVVNYQNKQLIINKENVRKVEVSDISGRIILNKIIENPFSSNTILPINLTNGSYLINITTEKENITHKLLVLE